RQGLARLGRPPAPILPGDHGAPQWPDGVVGSMTHCAGYRAAVVANRADLITIGVDAEPHDALPPEVLDTVTLPEERAQLARLVARHPGVHWDRLLFSAKESVYKAWFPLTRRWLDFDQAGIAFDAVDTDTVTDTVTDTDYADAIDTRAIVQGRENMAIGIAHSNASYKRNYSGAVSEGHAVDEASPAAGDCVSGTFQARLLVPGPVVAGARLPGFSGRWLVRDGLLVTAITVAASAERTIVL
ncbi:MAG: 4'-phosphopantetheinyl transferase family protein, partial [Actinocrinis sp.]